MKMAILKTVFLENQTTGLWWEIRGERKNSDTRRRERGKADCDESDGGVHEQIVFHASVFFLCSRAKRQNNIFLVKRETTFIEHQDKSYDAND